MVEFKVLFNANENLKSDEEVGSSCMSILSIGVELQVLEVSRVKTGLMFRLIQLVASLAVALKLVRYRY